jgi:hypothetical protein
MFREIQWPRCDAGPAESRGRRSRTKRYDNAAKALTDRDALAQMLGDDSLRVRQIAPS